MLTSTLLTTLFGLVSFTLDPAAMQVYRGDAAGPAQRLVLDVLAAQADAALAKRAESLEGLKSPEDVAVYQERLRTTFIEKLGGFPKRTPLNARVVFQGEGEGYRYEKVIFESRPSFYVTAILYLPLSPPPYPGVLVPCGHEDSGKGGETYQRASMLLARNGIAALCYDPVGQGERFAFYKDGKPAFGTTIEHTLIGVGAILTGANIAAYRIYDGMRGLDYLESRPEIDASRLGCTGNSGGGTLTSYIMALDPRVKAAAPSCYITGWEKLLDTIGPQYGEQNIFGQLAWGMDHADYLILRAPKPTLICSATRDFFDIEGAWNMYRQAKRVYTRLGYPERVDLAEVDEEHGFTPRLRATMVHWMRRWLLEQDGHIDDAEFPIFTDPEILCTETGRVIDLPNARTAFDLNRERMAQFDAQRRKLWEDPNAGLAKVAKLLNIAAEDLRVVPATSEAGVEILGDVTLKRLLIPSTSGVPVPAVLFTRGDAVQDCVLYLHEAGKAALAEDEERLNAWLDAGTAVLALDYSVSGELEHEPKYKGDWNLAGKHWDTSYRAYILGKSLVGIRTQDIVAGLNHLAATWPGAPIQIHAQGAATVPALHAAALRADAVSKITLLQGIPSWAAVVNADRASGQIENTVHAALECYDLTDLMTHICPDKVTEIEPAVPVF
ncbi:MAG: prolyl oligopeptidase family serine peptidase [Candidatus Hydrogenedentes bacterium]|nr:prolyl oligopeptidase family serine peptidase [Candidatus Hydrogenedentota bacterium]